MTRLPPSRCAKINIMANPYVDTIDSAEISLWKHRRPLLKYLDVELTERCNLNCIHCCINQPADDAAIKSRETSTQRLKAILKEAADLGCMQVRFTGGEPLLREDFPELYLFARKLGIRVMIFTNATLITTELADLFARIPPLEKIEVTVYGMKKSSCEAVTRTPGSHAAALKGIDLLMQKNIPFIIKGALLPPNTSEVQEFDAWAATLPWMKRPPRLAMFFDLRCRRDSEEKNVLIKKLRVSPENGLKLLARYPKAYQKEMKEFCSRFMGVGEKKLFSCGAGINGGCIDAYGHFQLCMLLRHPATVYDLEKGTLKDAVTAFFPEIRAKKAENPDYIARCSRCILKGLCEQCPGKSFMEHGTLDKPVEYLCETAHAQARYLGLLKEDEQGWEISGREENRKKNKKSFTFL